MKQPEFAWNNLDPDTKEITLKAVDKTGKIEIHTFTLWELPKRTLERMIQKFYGAMSDEINEFNEIAESSTPTEEVPAAVTEQPEVAPAELAAKLAGKNNEEVTKLFVNLLDKQCGVAFEFLGEATKDKTYNAAFFKKLHDTDQLTTRQFAGLLYNLWEVCHVEHVLASAGNALVLARVMAAGVMAKADHQEETTDSSESQ